MNIYYMMAGKKYYKIDFDRDLLIRICTFPTLKKIRLTLK